MVRIANYRFSEAHQYEHAVRSANVQGCITERGTFSANLLQVDLDKLWLQSGTESLARSAYISVPPARSPIFFLAGPHEPALQAGGIDLEPGAILFWRPGSSHHQRTRLASHWATMSLSPMDLAAAGAAITGHEIAAPEVTGIVKPSSNAMARLMSLHAAARRLAEEEPVVLSHPEVARALESALTHAMVACLAETSGKKAFPAHPPHLSIMKRFEEIIVGNAGRPLYLAEVCKSIGASERTLRRCCQEQLGMGPNHYLLLRRLQLARKALLEADHATSTVTDIATCLGFWELGRFSVAYRALFGETPVATLRRPPQDGRRARGFPRLAEAA